MKMLQYKVCAVWADQHSTNPPPPPDMQINKMSSSFVTLSINYIHLKQIETQPGPCLYPMCSNAGKREDKEVTI